MSKKREEGSYLSQTGDDGRGGGDDAESSRVVRDHLYEK
jgi:hypothetical protein